ncbi:RNA polymerase sigma-32 factor [Stella humosa]|uniref:RNA polymerase sigma-32 factor n=1 Tax=Stella humosa TaxID=94 RepID=A0A3N1LI71_9PROT|nr:RNA polymerase factor sigma-32 [Stella humosa]ROP91042.1 RNA polymerase sigma-32 factor [Stella humosa]BBK34608.1 RNA polymerase factor sigma-32 [Stella humosa]
MAHLDDAETQRANASFIRTAMRAPILSRDHESDLARRWRDERNDRALHELVTAYTRLVISMAGRFRHYGLPMGDLIQEGNVGLMQASERFDSGREVRFSTYAAWWIRSAMQDFVLRNWSIVRTGTTAAQKSLFFNLRRLRARIADTELNGMSGETSRRIAEALKVSINDVQVMEMRLSAADQSLSAPAGETGEQSWQDFLSDPRPDPEQVVIGMRDTASRSRWLAEALDELSPRERRIICERRLVDEGATLEDLGRSLGVSKERVRQLENRAMSKLRVAMRARVSAPDELFVEA